MAFWNIKNVSLRGVTGTVPNHPVKSADLPIFNQEEADTFDKTVGILSRYIAPEDVCASDLCQDAGERLLAALGWEKETVDVLLFVSVTGDYKTPPTSAILQDRMGLPNATFVLDVPMGCCGCIYGITVAGNLLSAGTAKRALVLVGDTAMRMGSTKDKSRMPLFGDSGTAMALEFDSTAEDIVIEMNTLGSGYQALMTPHGGYRHPVTKESFEYEDFGNGIIRAPKDALINGMDVFSFAISKPPISVSTAKAYQGIDNIEIKTRPNTEELIEGLKTRDISRIEKNMVNVLENYTLMEYPTVVYTKNKMQELCGERAVLMSGSGPSVYGLTDSIRQSRSICDEMLTLNRESFWTRTTY